MLDFQSRLTQGSAPGIKKLSVSMGGKLAPIRKSILTWEITFWGDPRKRMSVVMYLRQSSPQSLKPSGFVSGCQTSKRSIFLWSMNSLTGLTTISFPKSPLDSNQASWKRALKPENRWLLYRNQTNISISDTAKIPNPKTQQDKISKIMMTCKTKSCPNTQFQSHTNSCDQKMSKSFNKIWRTWSNTKTTTTFFHTLQQAHLQTGHRRRSELKRKISLTFSVSCFQLII